MLTYLHTPSGTESVSSSRSEYGFHRTCMPPSQYRFRGSCIPLPVLTAGYGATRVPAGVKARRVAQVPPLSLLAALPRIEALLPFMVSVLPFM
eukprot:1135317-Rhodomonas_salina.1